MRSNRLLEILPASLSIGTFIGIILLSFMRPVLVASFMLAYILYWFSKSLLMSMHLIYGYRAYQKATHIAWDARLKEDLRTKNKWEDVWHLVVIATYKEELPILESTVKAIAESRYPLNRIVILLATEERDRLRAQHNAQALIQKFGKTFAHIFVSEHPKDLPDEMPGKGSNISFAVETTLSKLTKHSIPVRQILVTTLDADNRVHPQFFAALTHTYLTTPDRDHKSYQPLPMFFNNIWDVPLLIRLISVGSSFWQMIEATRPYRLRNFSAHSQSLPLLIKSKFWSRTSIVEDGHQYWRSFFATHGKHAVVPIFIPIYQDAVLSPNGHLMTYREQYLQKLRWASGAGDIPYALTHMWRDRKRLPLFGWLQTLRLIEGHYSWATASLILAFFGWLPTYVSHDFQNTALSFHFSIFYHRLLLFAMIGMIISLIITRLLLPPRPKTSGTNSPVLEWLLTPIILPIGNILFGSLPALDAQLRLALGKYPGFRVTEKAVVRSTTTN